MITTLKGQLEVVDGGIGNSIQDLGRFGSRHMGIAVSGHLDALLARSANALVGNAPECACIEIRALAPTLCVRRGRIRFALAGATAATVRRFDGSVLHVPAWKSVTLDLDDLLEIEPVAGGVAYLAITGGIDTPLQLASRSTYQRALIGGVGGMPIATGQMLPCKAMARRDYREYQADAWQHAEGAIRVILGPQQGHFTDEALARFVAADYQVTPQLDRMGVRLEGEQLAHASPAAADIVSDAVTPGTIQVPGNGQPIVLLADCQTVGGYPKIATVIRADLPRLGQLRPGQKLRFAAVDMAQARAALRESEARWADWAKTISFNLTNAATLADDPSGVWVAGD
jgi:biotin-dependent carboxylase-like uncharacterized protein